MLYHTVSNASSRLWQARSSRVTDLDIYVENFKFARRLAATEPFKSGTIREAEPGPSVQTDEEIKGESSRPARSPLD